MKQLFSVVVALFISASAAFAATTQQWNPGWDIFSEPLNYTKSHVTWSVNPTTSKLSIKYKLVGATPNKLYQVGITFFCTTIASTFGQFPVWSNGGNCTPLTRQGVTRSQAEVELGVVLTDLYGNGSVAVVVGPIAAGTYEFEFDAMDGAGCLVKGGGGPCWKDFQSPGPTWGGSTTITIP